MVSTNLVKWDDTANRLTAYCSDDTGDTEIGPVHWDDANNKLELNCNATDFQVKWDDGGDNLEARSVDDECCEPECDFPCADCDDCPPQCLNVHVSGPDVYLCALYVSECCWMGNTGAGVTFKLKYYSGDWHLWTCATVAKDGCHLDNPNDPIFCVEAIKVAYDCDTGGSFTGGDGTWTIIPDFDCDDFYDEPCF